MEKMIIILLTAILCLGCSPARRLERLVRNHPELSVTDTLLCRDTVTVPADEAGTGVQLNRVPDSLTLVRGQLEIRLLRRHVTLYIRGMCKPDTVIVSRSIPVTRIRVVRTPGTAISSRRFILLFPVMAAGAVILSLRRRD
jgi:hypothetical protein